MVGARARRRHLFWSAALLGTSWVQVRLHAAPTAAAKSSPPVVPSSVAGASPAAAPKSSPPVAPTAPTGAAATAGGSSPAPSAGVEGYLVFPLENRSGQSSLQWMANGIAAAVAEKLEAHPKLRPSYGPAIFPEGAAGPFDATKAFAVARAAGAKWVVAGAFDRPNWKLQVDLKLFAVTDEALKQVAAASLVGDREAPLTVVDDVLAELLRGAERLPDADGQTRLRRPMTRDAYAFTLFGRALSAFRGDGAPKDLDKAEKTLQRVVLIDPNYAEAHRLLALVQLDKGDTKGARGQLSHAIDLRPDYFSALVMMARILRSDGKRSAALEHVEKALAMRPDDIEIRFARAELLHDEGRIDTALSDLQKVVAASPRHLSAHRLLVPVFAAKGQMQNLSRELETILDLDPDDNEARLDLGAVYRMLGRDSDAIAVYDTILQRNGKHLQATKFLGDLYKSRGEHDKAITYYERAKTIAPDDPRPYFLLGSEYVAQGDDQKAERIFREAQQFTRYLGETYNNLGAICYRRNDLPKAVSYFERAAQRLPDRPKVLYNYALALSVTQHRDQALEQLTKAAALDPEDAEIQYLTGVVQLRMGKVGDAERAFKATLARAPGHKDAKHNLALIEALRQRATQGERQELR